ncbi:MAG: hypothetical protein ABII82_02015 [Verrucomicrobiota bacterium]
MLARFPLKTLPSLLLGLIHLAGGAPDTRAAQPIAHPQVGVCTHLEKWNQDDIPLLIAEAGITWIRDDFYWGRMEREKGRYALTPEYVKNLAAAKAAGLKVIAIFNGGNRLYDDLYDPQAYARAAAWFARETKGLVHAIEILNEPANFGYTKHYGGHWNGVDKNGNVDPWVGKYVHLLNTAAKAIKAANPDIKVIGLGSVAPVNFRQIAIGIAPEVDGITEHPYSFRLPPEYVPFAASEGILKRDGIATADARGTFASQMRMYDELLKKHHGPKEKWLTEWGWPTHQEAKAGGLYAGFTENAQAKYILRRLSESLGLGATVTVIYDFRDDFNEPYNPEARFGLVRTDLRPKPSYHAVKNFNAHMSGWLPRSGLEVNLFPVYTRVDRMPVIWDGSRIESSGRLMSYTFADSRGTDRIVLWSSERADGDLNPLLSEIEIVTDRPIQRIVRHDLFTGDSTDVAFERKPGRLVLNKFTVPDSPVTLTLHP